MGVAYREVGSKLRLDVHARYAICAQRMTDRCRPMNEMLTTATEVRDAELGQGGDCIVGSIRRVHRAVEIVPTFVPPLCGM